MIMSRHLVTLSPDDSVETAASLMVRTKVTHLPVVKDDKVVGILTPTDLLTEVERKASGTPVGDLALSPCVPIYEETPLRAALTIFKVSKVGALPVLDRAGRLSGVLTDRDLFNKSLVTGSVGRSEMGIPGDEDTWTWEGLRDVMKLWFEVSRVDLPTIPVREIMKSPPVTVFSKTSVSEAARMMRRNDFGQLPVVDPRDNLVGMLYDMDTISLLTD